MIANTIIESTLRKLLVIPSGGTPTTNQYADGLEGLNDLIRIWSANSSLIYQDTREEITLSTGEQEFTLGATGDYVTGKPVEFIQASIRDSLYEYPLKEADVNVYARFSNKTTVSQPEYIYFRNTHPDSTFYFDSTTGQEYTLILTSMKELTEFPDGTTDISLPAYYETAFKYNLPIVLASEFGAGNRVTQLMLKLAEDSLDAVIGKAVNINVSTTEMTYLNGYIDGYSYSQDRNR